MKTYTNLYSSLCSTQNLQLAESRARKRKTTKPYVRDFERNLETNLSILKSALEMETYRPAPLTTFIVRDPKTRKISASTFQDRIVHHAICNITEPILSKDFIYDSFANQKGKGTHKAIMRLESFMRKNKGGYILKADIRHYFDTVDHATLLAIIGTKITDPKVIELAAKILANHHGDTPGKGMPKGNLTSQFWGNVYLNKFDHFVKHELRAKYYIRYVDDFVILHQDLRQLEQWKALIEEYLAKELLLELHQDKTSISKISGGITFLGFRIFKHHRLLKKSNMRRIFRRVAYLRTKMIDAGALSLSGWMAYASFANTFYLRCRVLMAFMFGEGS